MSRRPADRNLLAGILALQMDFIDRDQLVAAMNAWVLDKTQPLETLLVSQGALDEETHGLLSALITRHLKKHADDVVQSLAALPKLAEVESSLREVDDVDVGATLTRANALTTGGKKSTDWKPIRERLPPHLRYTIKNLHAKGGLGQVSIAEDQELRREVALKEIQDKHADDADCQARFLQEAEVTGGLEHPGIVPVYGLGHHENGRPYYAMRFIRGESLKSAIQQYHAADSAEEAGKRLVQFRGLISRFISVCQTIEYAHSRGVVHRDIKPENIMLGKYGETLVVDWGLAKTIGRAERHTADKPDAEASLRVSTGSGSTPTMQGTAVGTPAFMSPEQAAGRVDDLSPASDIYSLGATLYNLLTGKLSVEGKDPTAVMIKVQRGDYPPPRAMDPKISRGLEAICLKAMQIDPAQRYASALDLARDLEQWLADEPVAALPEGPVQRASRLLRRHRALVQTAAVALLITTVVAIAAALNINAARVEVTAQKTKAELLRGKAMELAEKNQKLADDNEVKRLEAETLATEKARIADEQLREAQKSGKLAEFLVGLFEASDPVGQGITFFIPKATSEQLTAKEILKRGAERVRADPDLQRFPLAKAAILNSIGDVNRQLGQFAPAGEMLTEALNIRRKELPPGHVDIATSCHNLGFYYHERGDFVKAEALYREALAIRKKQPGKEGQQATAATLLNLAWMMANEGEAKEAEQLFRDVLELRRQLFSEPHRDISFTKLGIAFSLIEQERYLEAVPMIYLVQNELRQIEGTRELSNAVTSFALGVALRETLGAGASESQLRTALADVQKILGDDNIYAGIVRYELGSTLEDLNRTADAEEQFVKCLKVSREQVQMQHPRVRLLIDRYANLLQRTGRGQQGEPLWEEFVTAQRGRFGPDHKYVVQAEFQQGTFLRRRGKYEAARPIFERIARLPECPADVRALALNQLGICWHDGFKDFREAEAAYRESIKSWEELIGDQPERSLDLQYAQVNLGETLTSLQRLDEAESILKAAQAGGKRFGGKDGKETQDYALSKLCDLYLVTRKLDLLLSAVIERQNLLTHDASDTYEIACDLAECWQLAELAGESDAFLATLRERTLQTLKQAQQRGFRNARAIRGNLLFMNLMDDVEFQSLLSAMEQMPKSR